jgi:hypothetical protein
LYNSKISLAQELQKNLIHRKVKARPLPQKNTMQTPRKRNYQRSVLKQSAVAATTKQLHCSPTHLCAGLFFTEGSENVDVVALLSMVLTKYLTMLLYYY